MSTKKKSLLFLTFVFIFFSVLAISSYHKALDTDIDLQQKLTKINRNCRGNRDQDLLDTEAHADLAPEKYLTWMAP